MDDRYGNDEYQTFLDEFGVDWTDPIMWTDDDEGLGERVAEVFYHIPLEAIPKWWLEKVQPYVVLDVLESAKAYNMGVVFDSKNNHLFLDRFSDWPTITIQFGSCPPDDIRVEQRRTE